MSTEAGGTATTAESGVCAGAGAGAEARGSASGGRGARAEYTMAPRTPRATDDHAGPIVAVYMDIHLSYT